MRMYVTVTFTFEALHRWPEAPDDVAFLRSLHRHVFHVKATKRVQHTDRDIEFILLKRAMLAAVGELLAAGGTETWSCEAYAVNLLHTFDLASCEVSEDGENGAYVVAE